MESTFFQETDEIISSWERFTMENSRQQNSFQGSAVLKILFQFSLGVILSHVIVREIVLKLSFHFQSAIRNVLCNLLEIDTKKIRQSATPFISLRFAISRQWLYRQLIARNNEFTRVNHFDLRVSSDGFELIELAYDSG